MRRLQRPRRTVAAAVFSTAMLLTSAAPVAAPAALPAFPAAAQASPSGTSGRCPSTPEFRPGELVAGTHRGEFSLRGFAQQPDERFSVMVTLRGTFQLTVEPDARITGTTADAVFRIQGVGLPGEEVVTGLFTDMAGTLEQVGSGSHREFAVEGRLTGKFLAFARGPEQAGGSHTSPAAGVVRIVFDTAQALCATASGSVSAPVVDETLAGFAAKGMTTRLGSGTWSVSPDWDAEDPERISRSNIRAVQQAVAESVAMATAPAGPQRRMAEGRFARIRDEIDGPCPYVGNPERPDVSRCLLCFERCPGPQERECMRRIWFDGYVKAASAWIEQELTIIRSWQGNYEGLYPYVREVLILDRELSVAGVDRCTEDLQRRVFDAVGTALTRLLDRMIRDRRPPQDILAVGREVALLGEISPALAERMWETVRAHARRERDAMLSYLVSRAPANWDLCDSENRRLWERALDGERQVELLEADDRRPVLEYAARVNPRESRAACGR